MNDENFAVRVRFSMANKLSRTGVFMRYLFEFCFESVDIVLL